MEEGWGRCIWNLLGDEEEEEEGVFAQLWLEEARQETRGSTGSEENRKCRGLLTGSGVKLEATLHSQKWQRGGSGHSTMQQSCKVAQRGRKGPGADDVLDREGDRDGQTEAHRRKKYTRNNGVSAQQIRY